MEGMMNTLRDEAPCVVVGGSLAALQWAVRLQQSTWTVLLTQSPIAVDPYVPAAVAAGFPIDRLVLRPEDVLKHGTVLYGRLLSHRDREIDIALDDGTSMRLPMRVLLHGDTRGVTVNGRSGPCKDVIHSDRVVLAGRPGSVASAAVELLTHESPPDVTWILDPDDHVSSRWVDVVSVLGGHLIEKRKTNLRRADALTGDVDPYGRVKGRERSFVLPDHHISQSNGGIYENVSTCAFATGAFPLSLHRLRKSDVSPEIPIVLSRHAKISLIKRGIAGLALSTHSLEHRVEHIVETVTSIRDRESLCW